jgi:hypothetical protein
MATLLQDLRLSFRILGRQPGFALVAVLVLGLGIAANTTIFSFVNALVLKPRLGAGEELIAVYSKDRQQPDAFRAFSYDNFAALRTHTEVFASLTAHTPALAGISEGDYASRVYRHHDRGDVRHLPAAAGDGAHVHARRRTTRRRHSSGPHQSPRLGAQGKTG